MKRQSRLLLETMSVQGHEIVFKGNKGMVKVEVDSTLPSTNYISVDAFQGYGESYCRRERCKITVVSKGREIFVGTFDELVEKVSR